MESKAKSAQEITTKQLIEKIKRFTHNVDSDYPLECDAINTMLQRYESLLEVTDSLIVENAMLHIHQLIKGNDMPADGKPHICVVSLGKL